MRLNTTRTALPGPRIAVRRFGGAMALGLMLAMPATAQTAVHVRNLSTPTRCAEEDNVSLALSAPGLRRLRVEALQPPYLDRIVQDRTAPDFSGCDFDGSGHPTDPRHPFEPRTRVLHENRDWRIVGLVLPVFWRAQEVPVQVGAVRDRGFHLVQLFRRIDGQWKEALVLYPSDGHWRLKPLPMPRFGDGAYGSSLLLGPVEEAIRPWVEIERIRIDTRPLRFDIRFVRGGSALLRVVEVSRRRTALDVRLRQLPQDGRPVAMLRSMHVAPDNADVSEVRWRPAAAPRGAAPETLALPDFREAQVREVRFGRSMPSRHNTSAPDIRFSNFSGSGVRPPR
ncbi:hypothetical protein [Xenophilus sp. Marseille-Q4582]|uniref:hypothetical protein n=1 Tax=Xenophilus sp. Marseille-Q4582 TaxID=2866600 RepID=UPI001CE4B20D|nr:hypothetical protein [Xenophilus sp. Marseille-Q4582]